MGRIIDLLGRGDSTGAVRRITNSRGVFGYRVSKTFEALQELVFPTNIYCISCGNLINNTRVYGICDSCMDRIGWSGPDYCNKCGKIFRKKEAVDTELRAEAAGTETETEITETKVEMLAEWGQTELLDEDVATMKICDDCQGANHYFDAGFSCMVYGSMEKEIIHQYKYGGCSYMGEKLGRIMLERILLEDLTFDLVTAVPMHPKKQAKRGYNQAELMAQFVAKGLGITYNNRVLKRNVYRNPMNKLSQFDRMGNVAGAYSAGTDSIDVLKGKKVLLVDDVYTTGSTADECSRILKEQGAGEVYVLTLATGAQLVG